MVVATISITQSLVPAAAPANPFFGGTNFSGAGWTAGGGVELMLSPSMTVKAEYLHYDLGSKNFS